MPDDPFAGIDLWDRQPGEPAKGYSHFVVFRDEGRARQVKQVAEKVKLSIGYLWKLSHEWGWTERAAAWDRAQDDAFRKRMVDSRRELAERELRIARTMTNKVAQRLQSMDVEKMSTADLIRMAEVAVKIERLAVGEPTDRSEQTHLHGALPEGATEQERRERMAELRRELDARLEAHPAPDG